MTSQPEINIQQTVAFGAQALRSIATVAKDNREAISHDRVAKIKFFLNSHLQILIDQLEELAHESPVPKPEDFSFDMVLPADANSALNPLASSAATPSAPTSQNGVPVVEGRPIGWKKGRPKGEPKTVMRAGAEPSAARAATAPVKNSDPLDGDFLEDDGD